MQYAQKLPALFQHTAARRRLVAGQRQAIQDQIGFNTQPPEGGWKRPDTKTMHVAGFNTQPPEGGWKP